MAPTSSRLAPIADSSSDKIVARRTAPMVLLAPFMGCAIARRTTRVCAWPRSVDTTGAKRVTRRLDDLHGTGPRIRRDGRPTAPTARPRCAPWLRSATASPRWAISSPSRCGAHGPGTTASSTTAPAIVRSHASDLWITCALRFNDRWAAAVAAAPLHVAVLPRRGRLVRRRASSVRGVPPNGVRRVPGAWADGSAVGRRPPRR